MFLPSTEGWATKTAGSICKGLKGSIYVEDTGSKQNLVALMAKSSPFSGKINYMGVQSCLMFIFSSSLEN